MIKILQRLFCKHLYHKELIFSGPPNSHRVVKHCVICGKTETLFHGTSSEYREWSGFNEWIGRKILDVPNNSQKS